MWFRIPNGKEKEGLVRVRQDDLLSIVRVARETGQRAASWLDEVDAPLSLANIGDEHVVADGNEVCGPAIPLETAFDRGEKLATVLKLYGEELAECADDHTR